MEGVGPTADVELRKKIVETMCSVALPVARAAIEGVTSWNGVAALTMCNTSLLVIRSASGGSNDPSRLQMLSPMRTSG
jgi:hypothetical protein